jgi:hypothetical protein
MYQLTFGKRKLIQRAQLEGEEAEERRRLQREDSSPTYPVTSVLNF